MTLEERLQNWGDCMRRRYVQGEAASKESDWISPQDKHWNPPGPPKRPVSVDEQQVLRQDALELDRYIAGLPTAHRLILRGEYVGKLPLDAMKRIARRWGGFPQPAAGDVAAMLHLAKAMLVKRLELPAVFRQPVERLLRITNHSSHETRDY